MNFRKLNLKKITLIFFLSNVIFSLWARTPSWDELRRLSFSQGSEYFFTATECPFYLDIRDVRPENVQVAVNYLPENVSFVSSKKEILMSGSENEQYASGTRLIVWFRFSKPGKYHLRPIDVVINGGFYRLGFARVEVFENPRFVLPKVSVQFENEKLVPHGRAKNQFTVNAGEHVIFTVFVQYAVRVDNCVWNIPENSLFRQIKQFSTLNENQNAKDFSTELYPVAVFDWQPLVSGNFEFPEIYVSATAYNGSSYDLKTPDYNFKINSSPVKSQKNQEKEENIFAYAFENPLEESNSDSQIVYSEEDLQQLLELHQKERRSFPNISSASKERREKEISMGLTPEPSELSIPILAVLVSFSFVFLVTFVIFFILKRNQFGAAFACIFVITAVAAIIYASQFSKKSAIFKGGTLRPIPEQNVSAGASLKSGSVAVLVRSAGDWVYIRHNETYGWVLKENLLIIK